MENGPNSPKAKLLGSGSKLLKIQDGFSNPQNSEMVYKRRHKVIGTQLKVDSLSFSALLATKDRTLFVTIEKQD